METYKAKQGNIVVSTIKFFLFLGAMVIVPDLDFLSELIQTFWRVMLLMLVIFSVIEIIVYFKKAEDSISLTENGLKLVTIWGVIQECKFTDTFEYKYRRNKLKSIMIFNEDNKVMFFLLNRYDIELSELKSKIEVQQNEHNDQLKNDTIE